MSSINWRFQPERTPGLEGLTAEEKMYRLYDLYCETGSEEYLGDILLNAEKLGFAIAYNRLRINSHFRGSDFVDYLQDISERLIKKLREEFSEGKRQVNIVFTIRSFYDKRARDIRDSLAARLNGRETVSLEALNEEPDGNYVEKIGNEDDYYNVDLQLAQEKAELCNTIIKMYIQDVMDSSEVPPKIMALCYARILYQLEMRYDWKKIKEAAAKRVEKDKRKISDFEKMVLAINQVRKPKKTNAPEWALERMGCQNFLELCADSQQSIHKCFDEDISWQPSFLKRLLQQSECGESLLWKDVVYTEYYNAKQTSDRANSLHKIIFSRLQDQIEKDEDLNSDVQRLDIPIRIMLKKVGKGSKYAAYIER